MDACFNCDLGAWATEMVCGGMRFHELGVAVSCLCDRRERPCSYVAQLVPPWSPTLGGDADTRYFRLPPRTVEMDNATEVEGEALRMFRAIEDGERRLPAPSE